MILVLTTEAGDFSHPGIIDWLQHYGASYLIITGEAVLRGDISLLIENGEVICNGINLTKEVRCVYYRRWLYPKNITLVKDKLLNEGLVQNTFSETIEIKEFLQYNLKDAIWIPNPMSATVNKLKVLEEAKQCGLLVPKYIVTSSKAPLIHFAKCCKNGFITKAIGNYSDISTQDSTIIKSLYTKRVTDEMLNRIPTSFIPTLFQERIEKSLELRIFYFDEQFFVFGILSQNNASSKEDSRQINENNDNQIIPMNLDKKTKKGISRLMTRLNLIIGSIDMIVDPIGQHYFLEVNPVGQISGYARKTGINIEKHLVESMMRIDNEFSNIKPSHERRTANL